MNDTPQVLLNHYLKTLKLPTFLREYEIMASRCALEKVDHVQYCVAVTELELIERERRTVERRIKQAKVSSGEKFGLFQFSIHSLP